MKIAAGSAEAVNWKLENWLTSKVAWAMFEMFGAKPGKLSTAPMLQDSSAKRSVHAALIGGAAADQEGVVVERGVVRNDPHGRAGRPGQKGQCRPTVVSQATQLGIGALDVAGAVNPQEESELRS